MRLVLLGTAGGPLPSPRRSGIAQAVVVGERVYLVDCGTGVTRQLRRAGLLRQLHQVFLTHLHSDHDCDYFNLFLLGWPILQRLPPVRVHGPGRAGALPPPPGDAPADRRVGTVSPANPTPGLCDLTRLQIEAHAYDINVRMRDSGRADLSRMIVPHEIDLSGVPGAGPADVAPRMDPLLVTEDDRVRVTTVLVEHAPIFPAFAYRFDADDGSVVISGDTAPSDNLVTLARGADVLVHEVISDGPRDGNVADESWEDRQRERHLRSSHTPLGAVGEVAAAAGVRRLVLTHFVPGDDELPDEHWLAGVVGYDGEVIVGHDQLRIDIGR